MEESILENLKNAVVEGNAEKVKELSQKALESGVNPLKDVNEGLAKGAKEVGDKFSKGEVFLTDLIMAGEAMKVGMSILLPGSIR
jgi:methanogenic corrinoid protein MtbC1